jgi:3-oxo-5alpha-steroid 4-dehydrogenase
MSTESQRQAAPGAADMSAADGTLPILAPLRVESADAHGWHEDCDLLVVGLGAAGAAAAIVAAEQGVRVLVVDRFEGGGATTRSGGIVYAGGGTRQQKALGYDDTPQAMFDYLRMETGDAVSEATLRRFCEDSRGLITWLESMGADFSSTEPPPKTSYPRDGIYLYYSGNEGVPAFAAKAPPAPRGHRTRGSWLSGKTMYEFMRARVDALGITVQQQTAVRRLITDAQGTVIGAELLRLAVDTPAGQRHLKWMRRAESLHNIMPGRADKLRARARALMLEQGEVRQVRARTGVLLSTGGFIFNTDLVRQHATNYTATMRLGATGCDGSGLRLGESVGGTAARLDKVSAWRFINPPTVWPRGVVIDANGRRFCNEQVYGARLGVEMCEQAQGRAWLVLDRKLRRTALKETLFGKLWFFQSVPAFFLMLFAPRARSLEKLAERIGVPAGALRATVADYNAGANGEKADSLGKSTDMLAVLDTPPYYAMDVSAGSKTFPCPAITLGGLRVDEDSGAVLNAAGTAIPGLYAAGRAAVGIASNHYVSGLSLADCLWSGRRVGQHAATLIHPNKQNAA